MNFHSYPSGLSSRKHPKEFEQFKQEAFAYCAINPEHPKADELFRLMWEDHHANGLQEIVNALSEYAKLLDDNLLRDALLWRSLPKHIRIVWSV